MKSITFEKVKSSQEFNVVDDEGDVIGRFRFLRSDRTFETSTFHAEGVKGKRLDAKGVLWSMGRDLIERYPRARDVLTQCEWALFLTMIQNERWYMRGDLEDMLDYAGTSNIIAVHIKDMRQKFAEHGLPYVIETLRGGRGGEGGYRIKRV